MIDTQKSSHYHPIIQLVFLVLIAIVFGLIAAILGMVIYFVFFGNMGMADLLSQNSMSDIWALRLIQIGSSVGMFILAPLVFVKLDNYKPVTYLHFKPSLKFPLLILIIAIMLFSMPVFELIASINQKMHLPDFLKNVEIWMKEKEDQAAELTKQLLVMKSFSDLAVNLLMIAIIPAIGEELMFRGVIQNILGKWFNNKHAAIWITAVFFSAIHVQFFGFFPRLFLGALFGYILIWGKNIWLPIIAHFMNNGLAVILAYTMQQQGKNINEIEKAEIFPIAGYIFSAIILVVLLIVYYKQAKTFNFTKTVYE